MVRNKVKDQEPEGSKDQVTSSTTKVRGRRPIPPPLGLDQNWTFGLATFPSGWRVAGPNLSGTETLYTRSQYHSLRLGPVVPLSGQGDRQAKFEWDCNSGNQVATPLRFGLSW